jgi:hypothetical protein
VHGKVACVKSELRADEREALNGEEISRLVWMCLHTWLVGAKPVVSDCLRHCPLCDTPSNWNLNSTFVSSNGISQRIFGLVSRRSIGASTSVAAIFDAIVGSGGEASNSEV